MDDCLEEVKNEVKLFRVTMSDNHGNTWEENYYAKNEEEVRESVKMRCKNLDNIILVRDYQNATPEELEIVFWAMMRGF